MTKLHEWEAVDGIAGAVSVQRQAVAGGWVYQYHTSVDVPDRYIGMSDPTAPHCQPTSTDAPPMTDEALAKWCDTVLGQPEPISTDRNGARWKYDDTFVYYEIDEPADERWAVPWCDYGLPASIAGPALWAAHKHGVKP